MLGSQVSGEIQKNAQLLASGLQMVWDFAEASPLVPHVAIGMVLPWVEGVEVRPGRSALSWMRQHRPLAQNWFPRIRLTTTTLATPICQFLLCLVAILKGVFPVSSHLAVPKAEGCRTPTAMEGEKCRKLLPQGDDEGHASSQAGVFSN